MGAQAAEGHRVMTRRRGLVERAMRGDREAFGLLASIEVDRLHSIARLVLRDADLAEDAVQEALVRCWRQLPSLKDPDRFEAWLHRILVHAARDEARRRRRHESALWVIRSEPVTGDSSAQLADRDQLESAFRHLSVDHRAVVVLHHYAGLALPEVAAVLGIPPGTAKSRHHHAMAALRAALASDDRAGVASRSLA
jgi:RNA polymerase sigma-70 factor, ECF subfamily